MNSETLNESIAKGLMSKRLHKRIEAADSYAEQIDAISRKLSYKEWIAEVAVLVSRALGEFSEPIERELSAANAKLAKADELDLRLQELADESEYQIKSKFPTPERLMLEITRARNALTAYQQSTSTDEGKEK